VIYEYLSSSISTAAALVFGIVIVLAVIFMPKGLMDIGRGIRRSGLPYFLQNIRAHGL
jgi:branched-chain amino acid transport system permease protein